MSCQTCGGEGQLHDGSCGDIDCCGAGDGYMPCWDCETIDDDHDEALTMNDDLQRMLGGGV